MKFPATFLFVMLTIVTLFGAHDVLAAGNIIPSVATDCSAGTNCSQFLDLDYDSDSVKDQINWSPTNGGVTVTDTAITGRIWGETVGWIDLNPTNGGVINTCDGDVSGYAWGNLISWVNFSPTNGGVTIDPVTGEFSGYAWAQGGSIPGGWIKFDCSNPASCVKTTWDGCVDTPIDPDDGGGGGGSLDVCINIPLIQPTVPAGYYKDTPGDTPGNCYLIDTPDVCPNLPGIQVTVPIGYQLIGEACVPTNPQTIDQCPNISGTQTNIPFGYIIDANGNCVRPQPPYDQCPNIAGNQPQGTICENNQTYICSDGLDNDNDGNTDYPNDPGCVSPVDNSEENPVTPPGGPTDSGSTDPGGVNPPTFIKSVSKVLAPLATLISAIGVISTVPGFVTRIVNLILSIPFYRRRRPWGIVYDAETKEPIDPAYVVVYNADTNEVIDTKITDINGRYGFLLPIGNYRIVAQKTHYQFPTQKLLHQQTDGVYDNLYFGDVFAVTDTKRDTVITLNIPMDRLEDDWNQEEKKRMGLFDFLTRNTKLWERISLFLFILGFVFAIYALVVSPNIWNTLVFILYTVLTILQLIGFGPTSIGTVTDRSGNPIPFAVIRVWSAHLGTQITQRVANAQGQYYLLVTNGDYYVTVDVKNASGAFDRVYTSETIKVHQGIVNKDFKVS